MSIRRAGPLVAVAALAAVIYGLVPPRAAVLNGAESVLPVPVRGVMHVHTSRSDGTGTIDQVAAAAAGAGMDFVIVTDHGDGTDPPEAPAYRHGVLSIDAVEISTSGGHVLALGLPQTPYPLAGEARDVLEDIARLGGVSLAAHPDSPRASLRWVDHTAAIDGLEWLNGDSEWRDEPFLVLGRTLLTYPFRAAETLAALLDRPDATLRRWDDLTRARRVVAVAGGDAHARVGLRGIGEPYDRWPTLRAPGYEAVFRTFSIALPGLVLGGNAEDDARRVVGAIRDGHVYSSIDGLAAPAALSFTGTSGRHAAQGGDALPLDDVDEVTLSVHSNAPSDARISLLRHGVSVAAARGAVLRHTVPAERAVYRVELQLPGAPGTPPVPWVVSNPIYVGFPRVDVAPEPRAATTRTGIQPAAAMWEVERSPGARGIVEVAEAAGDRRVALRYALDASESHASYAALVTAPGPALATSDALMFTGRADRPMRLSVQLRGADGMRWYRSVYLDEHDRTVTVPFSEMTRPATTPLDRAALSAVHAVLFVVDTVNTPVGGSGEVRIQGLGYGT